MSALKEYTRVKHKQFGSGIIARVDDSTAIVLFDDGSIKKFPNDPKIFRLLFESIDDETLDRIKIEGIYIKALFGRFVQ